MLKATRLTSLLLISVFIIALAGCGPKAIKEESVLDTPDNHFSRGMRELDKGNLTGATAEFERAKALNPDYAEAFSGMALVYAEQGDFKNANDFADKGISKNDKSIDAYIIKGRVITKERKGDDWYKDAVKQFEKAIKINPNSGKAHYYKGIALKEAYEFKLAAAAFRDVIELKADFATEANAQWELVQKIERAAPGTKVGAKIALIEKIDRADLAVLMMEELKLMELLEKKRPKTYDTGFKAPDDPTKMDVNKRQEMAAVTDIENHWAKNWIKEIVSVQGMDVFPDRTFHPDEKITRANYAKLMENVLIMATGDESLATKYIGEPSRFPDVNATHFAYNAICLMVDRGIMSADKLSGEFRMNDTISGADALLIIRDFQNALRMTF